MAFKKRLRSLNLQKITFLLLVIFLVTIFLMLFAKNNSNIKDLIPESSVNLRTALFALTTISITAIAISTIMIIVKMLNKADDLHDFYAAKADALLLLNNLQNEAHNLGSEFKEKLFLKKLKVISKNYPYSIKQKDKEIKATELL